MDSAVCFLHCSWKLYFSFLYLSVSILTLHTTSVCMNQKMAILTNVFLFVSATFTLHIGVSNFKHFSYMELSSLDWCPSTSILVFQLWMGFKIYEKSRKVLLINVFWNIILVLYALLLDRNLLPFPKTISLNKNRFIWSYLYNSK